MSKPKNWPASLPYLKAPLHGTDLSKHQLQALRTKPASTPSAPASETETPCSHVKIQAIREPQHPAHGQYGLFASQKLKPGQLILAYLGRVHSGETASSNHQQQQKQQQQKQPESDYDLWLDREADVAVDAAAAGNEGRFANDYRGVRERANARFGSVWCERWGELCVGIWVVGGEEGRKIGKGADRGNKGVGIRKGEEILVSYGKGFWEERKGEKREDEDGGSGPPAQTL